MIRPSQIDFFFIFTLIVGFTLRMIGIGVGLPDYPDPREPLIAQDILNLIHLKAPPEIYNWPGTAWFYLVAVLGKSLEIVGLNLTISHIIWLARFINVLLSTVTIWLTYQIGIRFYSRSVGRIAAAFLAVTMLHATNESRFALVDIPATFCVTLLLWLCAKDRSVSFRRAVWLGGVAGMSFAVKFTTAFAGLSVVVLLQRQRICTSESIPNFIGLRENRKEGNEETKGNGRELICIQFLTKLAIVIGVAALSFTVICPYWLIDLFSPEWNRFFEAFFYEASHYRKGHFGLFATEEINWLNRLTYLWTLLRWGMGVPLALLSIVGLCVAIADRKHGDKILLAFVLPYLLFVGSHKLKFVRHLLPIYPALTICAAASARKIWDILSPFIMRGSSHKLKWGKSVVIAVVCAVLTYSLAYTASFAKIMATPPTMIEATKWIEANIPPEEEIEREPDILFDWLLPELDRDYTDERATWVLVLMPNAEVFMKYAENPASYSAIDWHPLEEEPDLESLVEFYERIFRADSPYELVKTFRRRPSFLGLPISDRGAPFPMRALLHPEIGIYRLRE